MTTYCGTAADVITTAHPLDVTIGAASVDEVLTTIWGALDPDLRVAALAFDPRDLEASLRLFG